MKDPAWTYSKLAVILILCAVMVLGSVGISILAAIYIGMTFDLAPWHVSVIGTTLFCFLSVQTYNAWEIMAMHFILPDVDEREDQDKQL